MERLKHGKMSDDLESQNRAETQRPSPAGARREVHRASVEARREQQLALEKAVLEFENRRKKAWELHTRVEAINQHLAALDRGETGANRGDLLKEKNDIREEMKKLAREITSDYGLDIEYAKLRDIEMTAEGGAIIVKVDIKENLSLEDGYKIYLTFSPDGHWEQTVETYPDGTITTFDSRTDKTETIPASDKEN